jgi:hypothetical protein
VADVLRSAATPSTSSASTPTTDRAGWCARRTPASTTLAGVRLAHDALRPGGAAVFWSTQRYPEFEERSGRCSASVTAAGAHDLVAGRRHDYVMYVARRVD